MKIAIQEIGDIKIRIDAETKKVADARDELRSLHDELKLVLNSFEHGIEALEQASSEMESGIESLSEMV